MVKPAESELRSAWCKDSQLRSLMVAALIVNRSDC